MTSTRTRRRWALGAMLPVALALTTATKRAGATNAFGFPDNGTEQVGRGGAWVARASNPLATAQNPAGLAGQKTGVLLDANLVWNKVCFLRSGQGHVMGEGVGVAYPEVCNSNKGTPQVLPSLAAVYRATSRLGIGLSIAPPSVYGSLTFPETVATRNSAGVSAQLPSGQRYMLLEQSGIVFNATLGAGFELLDNLRVGAGFVWGFARYKIANADQSLSVNPNATGGYDDPVTSDVRADLDVSDYFMPGVTVGVLYSPLDVLDLGADVTAQQAFDGHGDLTLKAQYWSFNGTSPNPEVTESKNVEKGLAHFRLANPLDARVGARFHAPRAPGLDPDGVRDPLADDLFDVELDVSYTHNSSYDRAQLRFPASPVIQVQGTANGAVVPENNDDEFHAKDSVGLRLGGDYVILPGQLAARAGAWWEPDRQNADYATVAFLNSQRIGLALGGVYRLGPVDVEAAFMHVFFSTVDNGGNGQLRVVSGAANTTPPYRSNYGINGGRFRQSANIVSLGATARF
jgi:long-subunit fatty acid transport protein